MNLQLIIRALLSGALVVGIGELAKRNNTTASIVHSLPLVSLLALIWLYADTADTTLIARHMTGTFFFVLPSLPMFFVVPRLLRGGWHFWPALTVGVGTTIGLYFLTARLLKIAGIQL